MSKFDTHGGYFAPKDYLKVNEGGSHEENPNGGVQIGVDPEGTPNLLEEGEPVYKDYVYSDNITAEKEFLEQNHLPSKYDGKLYSKIADDILTEAEERPLDPISRNGLEALLGRLADAQEGQKQAQQQRELEDELASLSPEELDQLEQMLSQEEITGTDAESNGAFIGAQGEPGIPPEQMMGPAESMPMMSDGGTLLHRFDMGGPKKNIEDDVDSIIASLSQANAARSKYDEANQKLQSARGELWRRKAGDYLFRRNGRALDSAINAQEDALLRQYQKFAENKGGIYTDPDSPYSKSMATAMRQTANNLKELRSEKANTDARIAIEERKVADAESALNNAYLKYQGQTGGFPFAAAPAAIVPDINSNNSTITNEAQDTASGAPAPLNPPAETVVAKKSTPSEDFGVDDIDFGPFLKYGGYVNRFDEGGFERLMNALRRYDRSTRQGGIAGTYAIDRNFPLGTDFKTIEELENSDAYRKFTDYVIKHYQDPEVQSYLRLLDERTHAGVQKLFDGDTLRPGWDEIYSKRRNDHLGGIYHFSTNVDNLGKPVTPVAEPQSTNQSPVAVDENGVELSPRVAYAMSLANEEQTSDNGLLPYSQGPYGAMMGIINPSQATAVDLMAKRAAAAKAMGITNPSQTSAAGLLAYPPSANNNNSSSGPEDNDDTGQMPILPTWPRYAGAVGSGLLGLYNVFQQPDKYRTQRLNPVTPEGRIHLQNQVYNPIDQNMMANSIIAQGNATNRALRNSGLGPSSAAAILAADNNTTGNLGTGFLQTWDANNQRRNAVIAANNQAEAQRAQFDYTVDAARAQALNDAAIRNAQNDLMIQRLNNMAEGEKYQAISNQISNGLQALSGIGKENFAMNQINTNPYFIGYGTGPNGAQFYNPYLWQNEKKNKKKGE